MNLKDKVVDFFLNNLAGRLMVRATASIVAFAASGQIGLHVQVDPNEVNALLQLGLHSLISALKPRESEAK